MGSTVNLNLKCGILINNVDALELHPDVVREIIHSDDSGFVKAIFESKLMDDEKFPLPDDYAKHAGRPSLTEMPYMSCENDGYPFLKGHAPNCDGEIRYKSTIYVNEPDMCFCKWAGKACR